jgi:hypothetical protein
MLRAVRAAGRDVIRTSVEKRRGSPSLSSQQASQAAFSLFHGLRPSARLEAAGEEEAANKGGLYPLFCSKTGLNTE